MKTRTATAVAAVLLLLASTVGISGAVTPDNSLAADFDSSTTTTDTVVVAIGSPANEDGRAALVAANAIASEHNYTVVRVPEGELPASVIQTLSQRVQHDDLRNAIVVGVGQNNTDAVATALTAVGYEGTTLTVEDQITGESASDLLYRAALQSWDSTSSVYLTTLTKPDPAKVSLALSNETAGAAPVLAQSMGYADLNATLQHLGVSTVHVTPGISQSTRDDLTTDGFTVDESPGGVSLDQSLQKVSVGYSGNLTEDVVVVGVQKHIYAASQIGSGANSTVLVTEDSSTLGVDAETQLGDFTAVDDVYVIGSTDDVAESVVSSISSTVRANASVSRIDRVHGFTETNLRTSLLASGYKYGVLATSVTQSGENVTVDVTNIGYSSVLTVDNTSVTTRFSGNIEGSSPSGSLDDGDWIVTNDEDMSPGETFTVELEAGNLDNGGHPELDYYYVGSSGALIGATGGLGFFFEEIQGFADWLLNLITPWLPDITLDTTDPFVMAGMLAAIVIVAAAVVVAFRGGLRTMRSNS